MFLIAIVSAWVTHAEPCVYNAAEIAGIIDRLEIKPIGYADDQLRLRVRGLPSCGEVLEVETSVDEDAAHEVKAAGGSVLSASTERQGDLLTVRFTGDPALRARLTHEWTEFGNLRRFVPSVTLRWFATYAARAVLEQPLTLAALRRDCRPGVHADMDCDPFARWAFATLPQCLDDRGRLSRLKSSFTTEDPFVDDQNPRVRIRGVTRNLCGGLYAPRTPWFEAVSSSLLFGEIEAYRRLTVSAPSLIEVQGDVTW